MDADLNDSRENDCEPSHVQMHGGIPGSLSGGKTDISGGNRGEEGKGNTLLTDIDIMQLQFDTPESAYDWYMKYAKCVGFSVRKDDRQLNSKGELMWCQYVCSREGKRAEKYLNRVDRQREPKPDTRTGCKAMIRVKLEKNSNKCSVVKVCVDHNHALTPPEHVHLIPCHRSLTDADMAQVDSMRAYGVKTGHIMGFICGQAGGPTGVGFCRKDLYNHLGKQRRSLIADGDAFAALSYLQAKANADVMMFVKFTIDIEGRLENLLWCDGVSRMDYEVFGDVVAFDTTYQKNRYNKPLVIFSGVNHHDKTVVFACALLVDETVGTYKWVLETLLEAMGDKKPAAIVTDGDKAMRKAIKEVLPGSTHRLCAWHLQRNANTNIKHAGFSEDMGKCLYDNMTTEQWEREWDKLVGKYDVKENKWVKKMYKKREMWATSWLKGKFFAGIRTTSMCEGINSFIKNYVESKHSLIEFLHHFERALCHYRNNELNADFASSYGDPVLTSPLRGIETSAAKVYTREIFTIFKEKLNDVVALIGSPRDIINTTITYDVTNCRDLNTHWSVQCDRNAKLLKCSCSYFESRGIPCAHIICIMKHEHMDTLPASLILNRWTKNCKSADLPNSLNTTSDGGERVRRLRYAALVASANQMCYLASQDSGSFQEARDTICSLTAKFGGQCQIGLKTSSLDMTSLDVAVKDPAIVKTKGGPKKGGKRKRCTRCGSTGHNIRRCPLLVGNSRDDEQMSCTGSEDDDIVGGQVGDPKMGGGYPMDHDYKPIIGDIAGEHPSLPTQQSINCDPGFSEWFYD